MTDIDGYRTVSSSDQNGSAKMERKGVAGAIKAAHDGSAIEGASIIPRSLDVPSQPVPEKLVLSGPDGKYFWPLIPGAYELSVSADGYQSKILQIDIEPSSLAALDFTLEQNR